MTNGFQVEELALPGVLLIRPKIHTDARGLSVVPYTVDDFESLGVHSRFVQDYTSRSVKGTIRGLHYQRAPHVQDKLVRCSYGQIFDVAADFDASSPTFGMHASVILSGDEQSAVFVPGTYAHGFCVLSDEAITEYKMSDVYDSECASGIRWDDRILNIPWPMKDPVISGQDTKWPYVSTKV